MAVASLHPLPLSLHFPLLSTRRFSASCPCHSSLSPLSRPKLFIQPKTKTKTNAASAADNPQELIQQPQTQSQDVEEFQVLMAMQTAYNDVLVLDTPTSRLLLLDSTHNVHSMLNKGASKWTGSYWDEFAALPPVIPEGPVAIFGLGGGTAAHLMLELWPSLQLEGWEIDELLIHISRDFLGLNDIEKQTMDGGVLNIHIGDVFSPDASISGGYAGIIVDLFAEGKVLPQLEQPSTWVELYEKLKPNGRLMVNCGAGEGGMPAQNAMPQQGGSSPDDTWKQNSTIRALCKAFPGQVNWRKMSPSAGENYLALTGSLPDLASWSSALPSELKPSIHEWKVCNI